MLRTCLAPALAGLLLALAPAPLHADVASAGHQSTLQRNPAFGAVICSLPGGDLATFDGFNVDRWTAAGVFVGPLGTVQPGGFASFALLTPDGSGIVVGESSNGGVHLVQVDGSGVAPLAQLNFNYDACFLPSGELLVSAALGGFGMGNDLVRVTLQPPQATVIGHVPGASGPVAAGADGTLYYATSSDQFPTPAQSSDVLAWSAAQVQAGGLSLANATTIATGFDGAASLARDPVGGALHLAVVNFALGVFHIARVEGSAAASPVVLTGTDAITDLEFVLPGGPGSFAPWQPANGVQLLYATTDFFARSDIGRVSPKRPLLEISGPGTSGAGPVTFTLSGGVPGGMFFIAACPQAALAPEPVAIALPTFLFVTAFDLPQTRRPGLPILVDGNGDGSFTLPNGGQVAGIYAYQLIVADDSGIALGSSNQAQF